MRLTLSDLFVVLLLNTEMLSSEYIDAQIDNRLLPSILFKFKA